MAVAPLARRRLQDPLLYVQQQKQEQGADGLPLSVSITRVEAPPLTSASGFCTVLGDPSKPPSGDLDDDMGVIVRLTLRADGGPEETEAGDDAPSSSAVAAMTIAAATEDFLAPP